MNFTGTIWRPPYEAWSALIQVTAGCTHNKCKFCTLYKDLPFKFRMSPINEIEEDLKEIYNYMPDVNRIFLTGANPFVLNTLKLKKIANLAKQYLQRVTSIGCFARITDITMKDIKDLKDLRAVGYNRITIGIETGDDDALEFMNKGYKSKDILEQCYKLDLADIEYNFFYLTGIHGAGRGIDGAIKTAKIFNQLNPKIIGASMLTIYPSSELYKDIQSNKWTEASETEKLKEMYCLIDKLNIKTHFSALGASNMFQLHGSLPNEKTKLLNEIDNILNHFGEDELRRYRTNLKHL